MLTHNEREYAVIQGAKRAIASKQKLRWLTLGYGIFFCGIALYCTIRGLRKLESTGEGSLSLDFIYGVAMGVAWIFFGLPGGLCIGKFLSRWSKEFTSQELLIRYHDRLVQLGEIAPKTDLNDAAGKYKPRQHVQLGVLISFLTLVLPAIILAGIGYTQCLEHGLGVNMHAKPVTVIDNVVMLAVTLSIVPAMLLAIFIAGVTWMFLMSQFLSWPDIGFYSKPAKQRIPLISGWLERYWASLLECRRHRENKRHQ